MISLKTLPRRVAISFAVLALTVPVAAARADSSESGDAVTSWNSIATAAVLINPGRVQDSRAMAAVHAAIHDALNAIDRRYEPYAIDLSAPGASVDAAVAAAARDVLVRLSTAPNIEPAYVAALSQISDGPAKDDGIALGRLCANAILARLVTDGVAQAHDPPYHSTAAPGDYQRTDDVDAPLPPMVEALFPGWGNVEPWGIVLDGHGVPGPDPLASFQYALDFTT
jgi:hypothetical protein